MLIKRKVETSTPSPTKSSKRINKAVYIALAIIAIGVGLMLYWASASNHPLRLNQDPFPTRTIREHPTAGGVVFLTADFCKNTGVEGELRTSFVSDSREVFLPLGKERSPKGCRNVELPILIPKDIPADKYRIKLRVTYNINPLKQGITQEFYSKHIIIDELDSSVPQGR